MSTGFPAVEATCLQLGMVFDPWQADLNRCLLAKRADGLYAADTVAMSIPRQVGKTWDVGAVSFADSIIAPGTTTVWTAHRFKVARETFDELRSIAESKPLRLHIDPDDITTAAGNEQIPFRNGSRIVFAARERGAIRGFTKVRRLVLDEAQELPERALADLAPTMNQAVNPQIVLMGTPPKPTDRGEVFERLRTEALEGESEGLLYVELAAEPGCDPDDREAWRQANPSFPQRTPERAILRLRKLLSEDDFIREALGVWDDRTGADLFGPGAWKNCLTDDGPSTKTGGLGLAVSYDLRWACFGGAAVDGDLTHVRPLRHAPGTGWVVEAAQGLQSQTSLPVVVDERGPASDLIQPLTEAGVHVRTVDTGEVLDACQHVRKLVDGRLLAHQGYDELDGAVAAAVWRTVGDRQALGRKQSDGDISPLEAVTLAAWAARWPQQSAYSGDDADLMVV